MSYTNQLNQTDQRDQMNQINPLRPSCPAILQGYFLVISDLLIVDFNITQNGFSGTC